MVRVEANAINRRVARVIQNFHGFVGSKFVLRHVGVVRPALWWKDAVGSLRKSAPEIFDHGPAVNGIGNRLAHADIAQDGIAQVEGQIVEDSSGRMFYFEVGLLLKGQHHIGGQRVTGNVSAAFAQFEGAGGGVGHHGEA